MCLVIEDKGLEDGTTDDGSVCDETNKGNEDVMGREEQLRMTDVVQFSVLATDMRMESEGWEKGMVRRNDARDRGWRDDSLCYDTLGKIRRDKGTEGG